jgi:RNA polymerase sigma-70 factor, ECF subfamily
MTTAISHLTERQLLHAASGGDEEAFRRLVEPHRPGLHAHCYRTLGSLHDAEDAVQDALLRAWRSLRRFERRGSLRNWLYRIATNASLDALARQRKHPAPMEHPPPAGTRTRIAQEPVVDSAYAEPDVDDMLLNLEDLTSGPAARYEEREAVELAFVAAMQRLPARQRAVLVLRDVLGFSAKEVSQALETTEAAVNSALQRARRAVDEQLSGTNREAAPRAVGDARLRAIAGDFVAAFDRGDIDEIVSLLTESTTLATPEHAESHDGGDLKNFPRFHLPDELAA